MATHHLPSMPGYPERRLRHACTMVDQKTKCPRCSGMVVTHLLYEPYCLMCGWVDHGEIDNSTPLYGARTTTKAHLKPCAKCGADISWRRGRAKYCEKCSPRKHRSPGLTSCSTCGVSLADRHGLTRYCYDCAADRLVTQNQRWAKNEVSGKETGDLDPINTER